MASLANPPQTVSTITAGYQEWQPQIAAVGSLRAVNGADLSLQLAGIVDEIDFKSGDDVQAGPGAAAAARRRRHRQAAGAAGDAPSWRRSTTTATASSSRRRRSARRRVDTDAVDAENARGAGRGAAGGGRQEDRCARRSPAVSASARSISASTSPPAHGGDAAGARSDLRRFLPAAAGAGAVSRSARRSTAHVDTYPGPDFTGRISAINPKVDTDTRNVQVRATLPQSRPPAAARHVRHASTSTPARRSAQITLPQTAITYNPYGDTVYLVLEQGNDARGQAAAGRAADFVTTGATRGDQVAILKRRQGRATSSSPPARSSCATARRS